MPPKKTKAAAVNDDVDGDSAAAKRAKPQVSESAGAWHINLRRVFNLSQEQPTIEQLSTMCLVSSIHYRMRERIHYFQKR